MTEHTDTPDRRGDEPLDCPERECACCGRLFQPTLRRRLLCARCYRFGDRIDFDRDNLKYFPAG